LEETTGRAARRVGKAIAWGVVGGGVFLLVAAIAFMATLKIGMRASEVEVPDLTGRTVEESARAVSPLGLVVEVAQERHDDRVSSGKVLQQQPLPGASVRRGRRVRVTVSLGTEVVKVPDLVGQADRTSTIAIGREGLDAADEARVPSLAKPAGTVLAQVPPAESPAMAGMRVHLLVSSGPRIAQWVMPDLVGVPLSRAEAWVETAGLRKGSIRRLEASGRPSGTVMGQLPLAGYPVRARDIVELTVAR
jgi:eukaryotic-like serine/threonine-protein kinase